jgi:hypothetical protein
VYVYSVSDVRRAKVCFISSKMVTISIIAWMAVHQDLISFAQVDCETQFLVREIEQIKNDVRDKILIRRLPECTVLRNML